MVVVAAVVVLVEIGTQIAPFLPIVVARATFQSFYGALLFAIRFPFFVSLCVPYFLVFHWLPIGSFCRKAWLWSILLVSGVWWIDLQVEGVKKGSPFPFLLPSPLSAFPRETNASGVKTQFTIKAIYQASDSGVSDTFD